MGDPESVPIWSKVSLPHCVNAEDAVDPDVNYYQGPMWYKTTLEINNPHKNGRTILHFEGAGQKTKVYVYMTLVAEHVGGYDEWDADITEAVAEFRKNDSLVKRFKGKIPVSVRCDNSRDLEMMPSDLSDFTIYGGLYRYVDLMYQPEIYLTNVFAKPTIDANGKNAKLNVMFSLNTPNYNGKQIQIKLLDTKGKEVASLSKNISTADTSCDISVKQPSLWSPENPNLYQLEVRLVDGNVISSNIGFRNFVFEDHGPFILNGKRLLLKGTHRHEDHAGVGAAMTEDMMREEMILMKSMGVNFIRLGHYQQSSIILNLCDSLGIIVWEEIPWCRGGLGNEVYQQQGKRMLTNMIHQHYNHPSIIIWGLGNENDWPGDFTTFDNEAIRTYMKELNVLAHRLDTT
ncbi:MAG: glycoside hydrolase family 2, partial [Pseudopedobacter saltans]